MCLNFDSGIHLTPLARATVTPCNENVPFCCGKYCSGSRPLLFAPGEEWSGDLLAILRGFGAETVVHKQRVPDRVPPRGVPVAKSVLAKAPGFRVGKSAANLKREVSHMNLTDLETAPPLYVPAQVCFPSLVIAGEWTKTSTTEANRGRKARGSHSLILGTRFPQSTSWCG